MASGQSRLLSWTVDLSPVCSVVAIRGELDLSVVESLRAELDGVLLTDGDVVCDVSGLTFADSTGLRFLIDLKRAVEERGGEFRLREPSKELDRVLEVTGMRSFFNGQAAREAPRRLVG